MAALVLVAAAAGLGLRGGWWTADLVVVAFLCLVLGMFRSLHPHLELGEDYIAVHRPVRDEAGVLRAKGLLPVTGDPEGDRPATWFTLDSGGERIPHLILDGFLLDGETVVLVVRDGSGRAFSLRGMGARERERVVEYLVARIGPVEGREPTG